MPAGMIWEIAVSSFGIAAAAFAVGGWVFVRYHRDRHQFHLMQTALQQGITSLPGTVPGWVLSLRQGVLALVLGIGLSGAGVALKVSASQINEIPKSVASHFENRGPSVENLPAEDAPPPPRAEGERRGGEGAPPPPPERRPPQDPMMERWHRVETQTLIGLLAICAGGILALLGVVRIAFARIERTYAAAIGPAS